MAQKDKGVIDSKSLIILMGGVLITIVGFFMANWHGQTQDNTKLGTNLLVEQANLHNEVSHIKKDQGEIKTLLLQWNRDFYNADGTPKRNESLANPSR